MASLLAVDVGLRTGLALYRDDGRLLWHRSHNFGSMARLRRAVAGILAEEPGLAWVVLEGGGAVARVWERAAARRGIQVRQIAAEDWREQLLYPRQQRSGAQAKQSAQDLARRVIEWSGAPRAPSLRHDAAEAILAGLWAVADAGWLDEAPESIVR